MISIVLVEPQHPGNIGAVARVMKNFELQDLILINPLCNHLDEEAFKRSKHAKHLVENAKVLTLNDLHKYTIKIGTTGIMGSDTNLPRVPVPVDELYKHINLKQSIAILFGNEGQGLPNEILNTCDFTVTIPTSRTYHSLNLSHAVGIVAYELFRNTSNHNIIDHIAPMTKIEKEKLLDKIQKQLDSFTFSTKEKKETQEKFWKKFIAKANLSKRETQILFGFFRKLEHKKKSSKKQ